MKSAEAWLKELNIPHPPVGDIGVEGIAAIQADATADLKAQVEQLRGELANSVLDLAATQTALHDIFEEASRQHSNRDCATVGGLIATAKASVRVIRRVCDESKSEREHLRSALEKCVVALEHAHQHNHEPDCAETPGPQTEICELCKVADDAIDTAKPLLNKP